LITSYFFGMNFPHFCLKQQLANDWKNSRQIIQSCQKTFASIDQTRKP
jgi:hypothetical protein